MICLLAFVVVYRIVRVCVCVRVTKGIELP